MYAVFDVSLNGVFSRRTHAWCFFAGGFVLTRLDFRYNKTEGWEGRRWRLIFHEKQTDIEDGTTTKNGILDC